MVFTGRALYDTGVFNTVAEDVSPLITIISPAETPLLDYLSPPERPAQNILFEWLDDEYKPHTLTSSTALGSTTATSSLVVHDGQGNSVAGFLMIGDVLYVDSTAERLVVTATDAANDAISFTRAQAGTSATSYGAGVTVSVLGPAALEGADVAENTMRPRNRRSNYCQIFKKDLIISGSARAVNHLGVSDELDYQLRKTAVEAVRDLERTVILGKTLGNTLGTSSNRRAMNGLLASITTNVTSTATLTPDILNTIIRGAWDQGGTDNDLIVCSPNWKRIIDTFGESRREMLNGETTFSQRVSMFDSTYGAFRVQLNRWMPTNSLMVISSERVKVVPLQNRSFQVEDISKTGDSERKMLVGEYTLMVRNQEGMAQASA